ncbi:Ribose-5-phosphate isomerase B (Phosphoriboisomerase B) [Mycoplasmopsis californica]|uniref:RpiB/LacA/LacB family sugar-phosphate isomerase n=1 Tax=Mycoplasmopsis equigenitalium TaxID=114883 RepID=A0ABY5J292_9BACT|nr:RpiB/LacA/LacB family sugar-phosphate isomerase [Mycoplasmopsis equigenitalium]UUD36834.1 RpiB/LacA/LacB family sugar-phosphate isomerase [Mycoplasmopsis equigenitalium]VEU69870.1 Ribose-5-phosphate isomerase B (Phosphoriboisomerase B) [Mycoplasmopsis californica]
MKVVISNDHGASELKTKLVKYFKKNNCEVIDLGAEPGVTASYAEQGHKLANYVLEHKPDLAIGMCGTGLGISYALNRHKNIRAARVTSVEDANLAKLHNNANVLVFGGRQTGVRKAIKMIEEFMKTSYEGGRHQQRIDDIENVE